MLSLAAGQQGHYLGAALGVVERPFAGLPVSTEALVSRQVLAEPGPDLGAATMASLTDADAALMGRIMTLAPQLALEQGCEPYPQGGYRIVINTGEQGGQEVHHLHVHVIGGPRPWAKG